MYRQQYSAGAARPMKPRREPTAGELPYGSAKQCGVILIKASRSRDNRSRAFPGNPICCIYCSAFQNGR